MSNRKARVTSFVPRKKNVNENETKSAGPTYGGQLYICISSGFVLVKNQSRTKTVRRPIKS